MDGQETEHKQQATFTEDCWWAMVSRMVGWSGVVYREQHVMKVAAVDEQSHEQDWGRVGRCSPCLADGFPIIQIYFPSKLKILATKVRQDLFDPTNGANKTNIKSSSITFNSSWD